MSISVIIATYNRAALLAECLAQLARQQFEAGDEVVVVDNGSTDRTADVVAAAAADFPAPVVYISETRPGKSHALTTAIVASRGDLLAFTDDDVIVGDDWLATIRSLWRDMDPGLVGGRVTPRWSRPAPRWLRVQSERGYGRLAAPLALLDYGSGPDALGSRTALGANMVVLRRALDAAGGFPVNLGKMRGTLLSGEDHQLCERVQSSGFTALYDPRLVVQHYVPPDRLRVGYHVRWFFWSGITNAALDEGHGRAGPRVRHWIARMAKGVGRALQGAATAKSDVAVDGLVEVAFSFGYLAYSRGWMRTPMDPASRRGRRLEAA